MITDTPPFVTSSAVERLPQYLKLITENPKLITHISKPTSQNPHLTTDNRKPTTHNPLLTTQNPHLYPTTHNYLLKDSNVLNKPSLAATGNGFPKALTIF
jgi:hypothetical protein